MAYNYAFKGQENSAKAVGLALPISRKESIMICQGIRGLQVSKAKKFLEDVIALKTPVKFTRYNMDMGHKAGTAAGRFPEGACRQILLLLKSAEANAQFKGLSTASLIVKSAIAHKGPTAYHFGRERTKAKRTHVELVLEEGKKK